MRSVSAFSRATLGLGLAALLVTPAAAQRGDADLHRAYYLQHEKGDLEGALELYRRAAKSSSKDVRQRAEQLAAAVVEDLAASDFAKLVPEDTIFYLELNRPGEQLKTLLGQFGLLGGHDGESRRVGISPKLIDGLLGSRGIALAIDEIDPRHGPTGGVLIAHPGDRDVVRGLIETAVLGIRPVEPVGGHATFDIEGQALLTLTSRLVIVSDDRSKIGDVLERMQRGGSSLAANEELASTMKMRGDDLMFCCLNLEPVMPMIKKMIERETRRDPEVRAALAFMDVGSMRAIAGRAGVDANGLSFDMALQLAEDHRNIVFNLLRMPNLDAESLEMVPAGAAFFAVASLNEAGPMPKGVEGRRGKPVVTLMDFGRELFANVVDVSLWAMPTVQHGPWGPMPDVVLAARVNDAERSRALWGFLLGAAHASSGGKKVEPLTKGDLEMRRYDIHGVSVYLATHGRDVYVSPSASAIEASLKARKSGRSVLKDPAFADAVVHVGNDSIKAAALNVGRCCEIASHFMSDRERREMAPYADMLGDTTACWTVAQTTDRLAVAGRICGLPDMGPMVGQMLEQWTGRRGRRHGVSAAGRRAAPLRARGASTSPSTRAVSAEAPTDVAALRQAFEAAHAGGKSDQARALAKKFHQVFAEDANTLNQVAWNLLTEERYGNQYDDVALALSKTSNEASDWSNWYYLDTYAFALARKGNLEQAIKYQRKAVEAGKGDPRIAEAKERLTQLLATAKKRKAPKSAIRE